MQHDTEALIQAELAVDLDLVNKEMPEIINAIVDEDVLMTRVTENIMYTLKTGANTGDSRKTIAATAMVYGFLWGHKLASGQFALVLKYQRHNIYLALKASALETSSAYYPCLCGECPDSVVSQS